MNPDIRERLRRLGVHKGAANLKPSRPELTDGNLGDHASTMRSHTNGSTPYQPLQPIHTPFGHAHVQRGEYVLHHQHGDRALEAALHQPAEFLAQLTLRRATIDLRDALFLDTETTGLVGGAGTLVFLVGLGYFADESFVVEQFFLRDPVEEAAMLCEIDRRVNQHSSLVTFNGLAFDVPLLESRFILSRIAPSFSEKVHLDLLMPARRAWRGTLESCSLGSLEFHMLGVQRAQRDVPGSVIPFLYREYLASGGGDLNEDMQRVMYHNLNDILSMVTLTARLCDALMRPNSAAEHFAAARYYDRLGEYDTAERGYRSAHEKSAIGNGGTSLREQLASHSQLPITNYELLTLRHLARFLKRQGRPSEALPHWQQLADADDVEGLIEVAKHYEWRECNLAHALSCARRASRLNSKPILREAIEHRIARLERKIKAANSKRQSRAGLDPSAERAGQS